MCNVSIHKQHSYVYAAIIVQKLQIATEIVMEFLVDEKKIRDRLTARFSLLAHILKHDQKCPYGRRR